MSFPCQLRINLDTKEFSDFIIIYRLDNILVQGTMTTSAAISDDKVGIIITFGLPVTYPDTMFCYVVWKFYVV